MEFRVAEAAIALTGAYLAYNYFAGSDLDKSKRIVLEKQHSKPSVVMRDRIPRTQRHLKEDPALLSLMNWETYRGANYEGKGRVEFEKFTGDHRRPDATAAYRAQQKLSLFQDHQPGLYTPAALYHNRVLQNSKPRPLVPRV